jgi:hypothetical protein
MGGTWNSITIISKFGVSLKLRLSLPSSMAWKLRVVLWRLRVFIFLNLI